MEKSKYALARAMISLLDEKSYEDISINDLAKKAYVSRVTFYNHFTDKLDVLHFILDDIFEELLEEAPDLLHDGYMQYLTAFISAVMEEKAVFLTLRRGGILSAVPDYLCEKMIVDKARYRQMYPFLTTDRAVRIFAQYESHITFFSCFWFINHNSEKQSVDSLAQILWKVRKIGYTEVNQFMVFHLNQNIQPINSTSVVPAEKVDARMVATRNALSDALNQLLRDTDISKINVTSLVKAASVGRSSFYRHYEDIEDLLDDDLQRIYKSVIATLPNKGHLIGYPAILEICMTGYVPYASVFAAISGTDFEIVAMRAYRSVFNELVARLPYIAEYIPKDPYEREFYRWFVAEEHVMPVLYFFSKSESFARDDIEKYSLFMWNCRYFGYKE